MKNQIVKKIKVKEKKRKLSEHFKVSGVFWLS